MKQREIIKQLRDLKHTGINPSEQWLRENRNLLLTQTRNTIPAVSSFAYSRIAERLWSGLSVFLPRTIVYAVVRPLAVLLMISIVGMTAFSAMARAAVDAVPTNPLYPMKRLTEKTQIVVASIIGDKNSETKLHVEFAKRRAVETNKLIESRDPEKIDQAAATIADLQSEITTINNKLDENKTGSQKNLEAKVVKSIKDDTDQIRNVLQDAKNTLLVSSSTDGNNDLSRQITEVKHSTQDVGVKAVSVMVDNHTAGDKTVSSEEVRQAISSTLHNVVVDTAASKNAVDDVRSIVETAKSEARDLTQAAREDKNNQLVSSTLAFNTKLSVVENQTIVAALKTEVVSQQVSRSTDEAKLLLGTGNLAQAVNKIQEATHASKEAEQISDATYSKGQQVLLIIRDGIKDNGGTSVSTTANVEVKEVAKDGKEVKGLKINSGNSLKDTGPATSSVIVSGSSSSIIMMTSTPDGPLAPH